jgi:hypothetical protein
MYYTITAEKFYVVKPGECVLKTIASTLFKPIEHVAGHSEIFCALQHCPSENPILTRNIVHYKLQKNAVSRQEQPLYQQKYILLD